MAYLSSFFTMVVIERDTTTPIIIAVVAIIAIAAIGFLLFAMTDISGESLRGSVINEDQGNGGTMDGGLNVDINAQGQ